MDTQTTTAPLGAKDIRGAKLAFGELCKDESDHEWLPALVQCIDFIAEQDGSLADLKKSGLAAAAMEAYDLAEDEVIRKMGWIRKVIEDLMIGTVNRITMAELGKFFDAWANTTR